VLTHPLRMLAIDLRDAEPEVRTALCLNHAELEALMRDTCFTGKQLDLAIVSQPDRFEIYSTEATHRAAFRAVLFELVVRAGGRGNVRALPTTEMTGAMVARHLLRRAAGIEGRPVFEMLRELNVSSASSRAVRMFGPELASLFARALEAGWRAYTETAFGDPTSTDAHRDVDALEAERIVEEELVAWKAERTVVTSVPPPRLDVSYYSSAEPGSAIRLKAPAGLRSTRVA
jgi:glutamyl-tRNA reductase